MSRPCPAAGTCGSPCRMGQSRAWCARRRLPARVAYDRHGASEAVLQRKLPTGARHAASTPRRPGPPPRPPHCSAATPGRRRCARTARCTERGARGPNRVCRPPVLGPAASSLGSVLNTVAPLGLLNPGAGATCLRAWLLTRMAEPHLQAVRKKQWRGDDTPGARSQLCRWVHARRTERARSSPQQNAKPCSTCQGLLAGREWQGARASALRDKGPRYGALREAYQLTMFSKGCCAPYGGSQRGSGQKSGPRSP